MNYLFSLLVYIGLLLSMVVILIYNLVLVKEVERTKKQFDLVIPHTLQRVLIINTYFILAALLFIASLKIILG